jgi:hypothetical protein
MLTWGHRTISRLLLGNLLEMCQYSPSIGLEEKEWQIMLEQFIASGVVVKNEIINIDYVVAVVEVDWRWVDVALGLAATLASTPVG